MNSDWITHSSLSDLFRTSSGHGWRPAKAHHQQCRAQCFSIRSPGPPLPASHLPPPHLAHDAQVTQARVALQHSSLPQCLSPCWALCLEHCSLPVLGSSTSEAVPGPMTEGPPLDPPSQHSQKKHSITISEFLPKFPALQPPTGK